MDTQYVSDTSTHIFSEDIKNEVLKNLNPRNLHVTSSNYAFADRMFNLNSEYEEIHQLFENTFKFRDGKSAIIIGPRGSGKTVLVEEALKALQSKFKFFVIRLNGSYFKDDAQAIKEIARQLDWYLAQHSPEESTKLQKLSDTFEQRSIGNTMNIIMEILDKSRLSEDTDADLEVNDAETAADKKRLHVPIVFIIDEIDRYTHTAKQTLLYNLFDIAQSSRTGTTNSKQTRSKRSLGTTVSVIGLSTKTTVREQLEKRVKSRFSQRIIQINKCKELKDFCECIYYMTKLKIEGKDELEDERRETFNKLMRKFIFEPGPLRKKIVENFYTIKDLKSIRNELIVFIMKDCRGLIYDHLQDYHNKNVEMMKGLSESELKILVCCCRVKIKNNIKFFNFDMAFNEYHRMMTLQRRFIQAKFQVSGIQMKDNDGGYLMNRDAMQVCWERLCSVGLLERQNSTISSVTRLTGASTGKESFRAQLHGLGSSVNGDVSTPNGVCVCGVELDDIVAAVNRDKETDNKWITEWSKISD